MEVKIATMMAKNQTQSARKRVLLVEDDPNDIELAVWMLSKKLDCDVICAGSAAEVETALQGQALDVIVSDSGVSDMDGMTALKTAQTIRPEVPFVFCSGEAQAEKVALATQAGAASWVKKDARYANLITEIKRLCGG